MTKRPYRGVMLWLELRVDLPLGALVVALACSAGLCAPDAFGSVPSSAIRYTYTPDSQLSAVIKPEAEYAFYTWDAAGNLSSIAKKSSTKLSIIELEPSKGAVGETIDIWGTGFSSTPANDTVKFHGTAATVTAASAYELAVKVPSGATTGTITVQTTTEGPVTSSQSFTVGGSLAPTITSLSTTVAVPGTVVTITGTNFSETNKANDYVTVNQTMAEVTSATSTSLKFVVPEATASGKVSVSTPNGSVAGPFLYIPPPGYTTAQIGPTANLTLNNASMLSITAATTVGLATVEGTSAEMVSAVLKNITITSGTAYVYNPHNEPIGPSTGFSSGKEPLIEPITLPISGTYTILIVPASEDTGKLELTAYKATEVTGSLSPTTSGASEKVSLLIPGQKAKYTVSGTAGEEVSLKVSEFSGFSKTTYLEWFNPKNEDFKEKEFTSKGFMEEATLSTTGTYHLVVNPYGLNTGSLELTAYNATAVTGSITPTSGGESKTVTTSVPGQRANITFSGNAEEEVSLVLSESTIKNGSVSVLTPEGATVSESSVSFGTSTTMDGTHGALKLPKTGTYTIHISASEEETGSVKLTAYKATEVTGSLSPTTSGASEKVSLLIPGQKAKYTVSGTAGEEVSLKVSEFSGFSKTTYLEWFNPKNEDFKEKGFTSNGFMEEATLSTTGTYHLVVNPYGLNTGSLKVTAYSDVTGSITPTSGGESKTVTINGPGQNARITFSGKSGEEVSVVLSESTIKSGHVSIENPEGSRVDEEKSFASGEEAALGPVSLPSTGTYTILIKPEGEYTGSVKLTAYKGSPPHGMIVRRRASGTILTLAGGGAGPIVGDAKPVAPDTASANSADVRFAGYEQASEGLTGQDRKKDARAARRGAVTLPRQTPRDRTHREANHVAVVSRRSDDESGTETKPTRKGTLGATGRLTLEKSYASLPRAVRSFHATSSDVWFPRIDRRNADWTTGQRPSPWATLASPAPMGSTTTALAGQALKLNGLPLAGLHVAVEGTSATAVTESRGQFLLTNLPAGHDILIVGGGTIGGQRYGSFEIGVQIVAHKETTLDAPIWMTPLDPTGDHRVASPTTGQVSLTTPRIPGLEVRLPAGTVIRNAAGQVVHNLNITPIPVDRTPFPLPLFDTVPLYFTIQPGRVYLSKGAQIIYPNYGHLRPGQRARFWNYDPHGRGWYIYGEGTVTPDGKQLVPDPGVRVWEFTGAMTTEEDPGPKTAPKPGGKTEYGDPVDSGTGLLDYRKTDLVIPDTIPIVIERTYRQGDPNNYSFGIGTTSVYNMRLWSNNNYHEADLVLPDGGEVLYKRVSPGEGYKEAEYKATNTPSIFYDSTITWNESVPGWDLTLTNGTTYIFGELAPLEAIRDRQGQQLTITRENGLKGNIKQITSPHGRWVKFTYSSSNDVTELKDNGGRTLKYTYNKEGLLESATDAAERTTKYEYNSSGDMTAITDARGNKYLETEYESHGRVSKQKLANGGVYEFSYTLNGEGNVESTTVTEPRENKRKVTFNSEGYPTSETLGLGSTVEQKTTYERQSGTGFVLSSTDARSRKTTYEYDSYGNVTSVTRLAGTSSAQTYKYTYEPQANELTKETDPLGHSTTYKYNSLGELIAKKDPLGHTTHYEYNSDGQLTGITDPRDHKTTIAYERGEPASETDPLGRTTKQFVDVLGRVVSTAAPGGQQSLSEYNNDNQITKTTDPAGDVTSYEYDADGDLVGVTDPLKHKTTLAYTKMDLVESEGDPLEKKTTAVYDTGGNLIELTDRRGKSDKFTYDALNRLTEARYGVSGETAESTIKYEYDNGNRLTKIVDSASGTYTPEYDELNRLKALGTPQGTIKYEYDEANRRTSMTVPGQEALKYSYNEGNLLTELKRGSQTVSLSYNEDNSPAGITLPDGVEEQYGYDEANEPTSITFKKGSTTLGELDYSYDLDGRKEAEWGSYARTSLPEAFSSAKYNADNEQTERGSKNFTYDADGDLTSDGTNEYKWNARGQLTGISGTIKATYGYDPFGRRITRTLGSTTTELLNDGPNVVQEDQSGKATANLLTGLLPDQVFGRTTSKSTESLLTDALGSTIALAGTTGSAETSYTYDPLGGTSKEGTASENEAQYAGQEDDGNGIYYDRARYYSPAAGRFLSEDPVEQAIGYPSPDGASPYTGFENDGVGIVEARARYYDPTLMRFVSQDPLEERTGGANLYGYAEDSPTNATDPTGAISVPKITSGGKIEEERLRKFEEENGERPRCGPRGENPGLTGPTGTKEGQVGPTGPGGPGGDGTSQGGGPPETVETPGGHNPHCPTTSEP